MRSVEQSCGRARGCNTCNEEEGVARKDEPDEQASLGKKDGQDSD